MARILFFDTETTGLLKPTGSPIELQPHIIELYMCLTTPKGKVVAELDQLINPGVPLPSIITTITGISPPDLAGKPAFGAVYKRARDILREADTVVAHNLTFDMGMLGNEFRRLGKNIRWPKRKICTVECSEHLKGHRLNLADLYFLLFEKDMKEAHRAKQDVRAMMKCYFELRKRGEL